MLFIEDYSENDQNTWLVSPYSRPGISITCLYCSTRSSKKFVPYFVKAYDQDRVSIEDQTRWYVYIWKITTETEYADGPA